VGTGQTQPSPVMEVHLIPEGAGCDKFLWMASHVPAPGVPPVDRCPRIWGRCTYDYMSGPDEPADGEEVMVTITAPSGASTDYILWTDENGEFLLDANEVGDYNFGTTELGEWTASAFWDPKESDVPVVVIERDMDWEVEWYIGHVSD